MLITCPNCGKDNIGAYLSELVQRSDDSKMFFLNFHCISCLHEIHLEWHLTVQSAVRDEEYEEMLAKEEEEMKREQAESA